MCLLWVSCLWSRVESLRKLSQAEPSIGTSYSIELVLLPLEHLHLLDLILIQDALTSTASLHGELILFIDIDVVLFGLQWLGRLPGTHLGLQMGLRIWLGQLLALVYAISSQGFEADLTRNVHIIISFYTVSRCHWFLDSMRVVCCLLRLALALQLQKIACYFLSICVRYLDGLAWILGSIVLKVHACVSVWERVVQVERRAQVHWILLLLQNHLP